MFCCPCTLFIVVNNIDWAWIGCNNAEKYCWQHWTIWAAKLCSILFSSEQVDNFLPCNIWSENSCRKSEAQDGGIDVQCQSLSIVFVCAVKYEGVGENFVFYFDIRINIVVLWIKKFSRDRIILLRKNCSCFRRFKRFTNCLSLNYSSTTFTSVHH